jgi:antitoxin (DNA-binding transcriptional repressor) of toxin-antitoxin stability system
MKIAGIRELRAKSAHLLGGAEPVLVTRHGKVSGVYVPLADPARLPDDLRRELATTLGKHLAKALTRQGVTEPRLAEDFDVYRQRRRGR